MEDKISLKSHAFWIGNDKGGDDRGEYGEIYLTKPQLIEQLKPDISKIKEGDEVWVKAIQKCGYIQLDLVNSDVKYIAHFPKQEQPQPECRCGTFGTLENYGKCPIHGSPKDKSCKLCNGNGVLHCDLGNPYCPECNGSGTAKPKDKSEPAKPSSVDKFEKLEYRIWSCETDIKKCMDAINTPTVQVEKPSVIEPKCTCSGTPYLIEKRCPVHSTKPSVEKLEYELKGEEFYKELKFNIQKCIDAINRLSGQEGR
jgi:hypothetical protein